ncbi:MAG: hypothetical protein HYR79_11535 [Nitrospirae bacterium]|nr:hypothetical protein [Nitrospirota bacterium]
MNPNSTIIWENDQSYVTLTHEIYSYNLYLVYGDKKIDQIIALEDDQAFKEFFAGHEEE